MSDCLIFFEKRLPKKQRGVNGAKYRDLKDAWIKNSAGSGRSNLRPSHLFAQATGIVCVAADWKLPQNMTADVLFDTVNKNHYSSPNANKILLKEVIELNPELKPIRYNGNEQIYHFLAGVASGFNKDDIDHYLNRRGHPFKELYRGHAITKKIGVPVAWIVSPETSEKILDA